MRDLAVGADDLYGAHVGEIGDAGVSDLEHGVVVVLQGGVQDPAGGRQQLQSLQRLALAQDGDVCGA